MQKFTETNKHTYIHRHTHIQMHPQTHTDMNTHIHSVLVLPNKVCLLTSLLPELVPVDAQCYKTQCCLSVSRLGTLLDTLLTNLKSPLSVLPDREHISSSVI